MVAVLSITKKAPHDHKKKSQKSKKKMGLFFKFCVVLNLVAALVAGPLMIYDPAAWHERNVELGVQLVSPACRLVAHSLHG
jgi:hypothetical protein